MLLLGPVALSSPPPGYRFARYYTGRPDYVREGPPAPLMRLLVAPVLVLSTLTLFGTGVALLAVPHRGAVLGLHKASFIVWFGAMTIHVLAYTLRALKRVRADLSGRRLPGRALRVAASGLAVAAGVGIAVATYPLARPWFHSHFRFERCGAADRRSRTTAAVHATPPRTDPAWLALRLPPVHPGPLPGYLLIADRNNNRALVVSPDGKVVWADSALRGPDDAFFTPGWRSIITNEEFNDTLTQVRCAGSGSSGTTATQASRAPRPATSTLPTTPTACRTATRRSRTSRTAASSSSLRAARSSGSSAAAAPTTRRGASRARTATHRSPTGACS